MAAGPYGETEYRDTGAYESTGRGVAGQIFLWVAWAAAAIFWGFSLTTGLGILSSTPAVNGPGPGEADAGGVGWMLINFVGGLIVLGGAIAYGAYRYASRDKRLDPMTEAATHAEYDEIESAGGDIVSDTSPESERRTRVSGYRAAQRGEGI